MMVVQRVVPEEIWTRLREFTQARIGLGRVGHSLPLAEVLGFQFAHAQARDAVLRPANFLELVQGLEALGAKTVEVHSQVRNRDEYLRRPDYGRRLDEDSADRLRVLGAREGGGLDVVFIVGDGLSSFAVEKHALPVLDRMRKYAAREGWRVGPVVIARQARVALSDEVGGLLGARCAAILIGERPGLSSADSLGIYLTYGPKVGNLDAARNCISNIHPTGLSHDLASHKLHFLLREALRLKLSGVALKDTSDQVPMLPP